MPSGFEAPPTPAVPDGHLSAPGPVAPPILEIASLAVGFRHRVVQRDLSFRVRRGSVFAVMGGSGCGKSTVLRAIAGLLRPFEGDVLLDGTPLWRLRPAERAALGRSMGVLFQNGALWSSLSVAENVALPLQLFARLPPGVVTELVQLKLALVGLPDHGRLMPAELSGGMRKRAALARALALDPPLLLLDEPSAGLDPVSSRRLDELVLELRDGLGITVLLISHELPSLFAIADDGVFLDADRRTAIAHGSPRELRDTDPDPTVRRFMHRDPDRLPAAGQSRPAEGDLRHGF
ncbi:ABC transporter ATP-binding protein [Rhizosaccharibacter radicis]|uniref:ATP-binding cassette domain-containing protein n=1 Tax=Rhizosaccharibacter radicis TaxID=2782605 RepID=A0ABT1W3P9_9PROT|nr:ATP-binding cassette domain-containing protein [Acetobacteraceae bacterium KSS12]